MTAFSLIEFAARLAIAAEEARHAEHEVLEKVAVALEDKAKSLIGSPQAGWPPLAPSTIERKGADTPLLETGELSESIEHTVDAREAYVGTNDPKAKFHEFGTSHVPPRPFLGLALAQIGPEIGDIAGPVVIGAIEAGLGGGRR